LGLGGNMRKSNFYSDSLKQQQQREEQAPAGAGKMQQPAPPLRPRPGILKLLTSPVIFQQNSKTFPKT